MNQDIVKNDFKNAGLTRQLSEADKILDYLINGDESKLTEKQIKQLDKYNFIEARLRHLESRTIVAKMVTKRFNISLSQAYRDIQTTQEIYGKCQLTQKDYYKAFLVDSIVETMKLAKEAGDYRSLNSAQKNLIVLMGFDKEDPSELDPSMFQQHVLIINSDIETLGLPKIDNLEGKIRQFKKAKPIEFDRFTDVEDAEDLEDDNQ